MSHFRLHGRFFSPYICTGEAPQAKAVPCQRAPPLRLHVGRQPLRHRAAAHQRARHAHARRLQGLLKGGQLNGFGQAE